MAHANAIRAHVNTLGAKAYWAQFEDAPDYVVMFIPGEHFLTAALEQDPTLWDYAFDKKVLLATPDQPHSDRAHRRCSVAPGALGQRGASNWRARQGTLRPPCKGR